MARRDTKSLRTMGFSCIVGAAVLTALAIATQVVQASTDVSKD